MYTKRGLYWFIFVAMLGSLLLGFNLAVISGAITSIKDEFVLTDMELGFLVSSLIIGSLVGVFACVLISDAVGRRPVLFFAVLLFSVSAIGSGAAQSSLHLIIARLIGGIAVGAVSVVVPIYINEIAPSAIRRMVLIINQIGIIVGVLLSYVLGYSFIGNVEGWRYMFYGSVVISIPFLLFFLFPFPESPFWLLKKGNAVAAKEVLKRIVDEAWVEKELKGIQMDFSAKSNNYSKSNFKELIKEDHKILKVGVLLAVFQQLIGVNVIVIYAPTIIEKTGVGRDTALLQSVLLGVVYLLFTLIGIWLLDKIKRKQLLMWGASGIVVSLSYLVYSFLTAEISGMGVFIGILGFIAFYAVSFSLVIWAIISELHPNGMQNMAMKVVPIISWICTLPVIQFFPWVLEEWGAGVCFSFFLIFSILLFVFVLIKIPATKEKIVDNIAKKIVLANSKKES